MNVTLKSSAKFLYLCFCSVPIEKLRLRLGDIDISQYNNTFVDLSAYYTRVHPKFTATNPPRNDIALIRLVEPVRPWKLNVLPICMPDAGTQLHEGQSSTIAGWGRLSESKSRVFRTCSLINFGK
jgi:Trypsin